MPHCNTEMFQIFRDHFSEILPDELKIMLLDKGAFHKSNDLVIPDNIVLLFIPPYSPELNPAEKIWCKMKRVYTNMYNKTLEDVSTFITEQVNQLTNVDVKSISGFEYILACPIWTKLN